MTASRYIYSKLDLNMAVLRFWQNKPQTLLDILHFDTPLGWYVFEGFLADAVAPDFKLVNKDNEPIDAFDQVDRDLHKDTMEKYVKAKAEANKQYVIIGMFDFDDGQGERFYYLTDKHITELEIYPGTKKLRKLSFNSPVEEPTFNQQPITLSNSQLQKVRLIGEYDRRIGKFRSRYEAIIDNLVGLSILDQQLVLLAIRTGSGIRSVAVPERYLSDAESRQELEDALENWGMNLLLVVPMDDLSEDKFQFKLDFGEGSPPLDWTISRSNLLRGLSIRMGTPEEIFNGAEIGMRSAETNHGRWLTSLRKEQHDCNNDWLWICEVVYELDVTETDTIRWNPFVEPDEQQQIEVFSLAMEALEKALRIQERAGIPLDYIKQKLNLDYETDDSLIEKYEQNRELLQQGLRDASDKSSSDEANPSDDAEDGSNGKQPAVP